MLGLRAVVVALGTVLTVLAAVALRADSTGPVPRPAALAALAAAVALAQWQLLGRSRHTPTLLGGLLLTQLGCQLALQALGGTAGDGLPEVLCCPPAPADQDAGVVALVTAQAGLALLAVQVVAASLTAVSLRSAHVAVLDAVRSTAASLRDQLPLGTLLRLLGAAVVPVPPARPLPRRRRDARRPLRSLTLARTVTRRGPPRRPLRPPSSLPVHRPVHLPVHLPGAAVT